MSDLNSAFSDLYGQFGVFHAKIQQLKRNIACKIGAGVGKCPAFCVLKIKALQRLIELDTGVDRYGY
jgi:hypothetical protein